MVSGTFWARTLEAFLLAFGSVFVAQLADIQGAVNAGDWGTLKKVGISLLAAGFVAGFKAVWLLVMAHFGPPPAQQALRK